MAKFIVFTKCVLLISANVVRYDDRFDGKEPRGLLQHLDRLTFEAKLGPSSQNISEQLSSGSISVPLILESNMQDPVVSIILLKEAQSNLRKDPEFNKWFEDVEAMEKQPGSLGPGDAEKKYREFTKLFLSLFEGDKLSQLEVLPDIYDNRKSGISTTILFSTKEFERAKQWLPDSRRPKRVRSRLGRSKSFNELLNTHDGKLRINRLKKGLRAKQLGRSNSMKQLRNAHDNKLILDPTQGSAKATDLTK